MNTMLLQLKALKIFFWSSVKETVPARWHLPLIRTTFPQVCHRLLSNLQLGQDPFHKVFIFGAFPSEIQCCICYKGDIMGRIIEEFMEKCVKEVFQCNWNQDGQWLFFFRKREEEVDFMVLKTYIGREAVFIPYHTKGITSRSVPKSGVELTRASGRSDASSEN